MSFEIKLQEPGANRKKIVLNGVEGWGKTTVAAFSENPLLVMAGNETSYRTLLNNKRAPAVNAVHIESWPDLLEFIGSLKKYGGDRFDTLGLDSLTSVESMLHEYICDKDFHGDWGENGFTAYGRGYSSASKEISKLLDALDSAQQECELDLLVLGHVDVTTFKNPMGADFDRYTCAMHERAWKYVKKWADDILFATFMQVVEAKDKKPGTKGKGKGGQLRVIYTEHCDAFDAKNRSGLPRVIDIPNNYEQAWGALNKHYG